MDTFESEYPFGNFLEDSMFYELSEFLQSYFQKKNAANTMAESNIPMPGPALSTRGNLARACARGAGP